MNKGKEDIKNVLSAFTSIGKGEKKDENQGELTTDAELSEALQKKRLTGRGRPRKNGPEGKKSDGYSRYTLIANDSKMAKLKEIAFRETLTQKEVYEAALDLLIEKYEAKHGEVVPKPQHYKGNVNKLFD